MEKAKIVVVVVDGIVETIFYNQASSDVEVEVLDFDVDDVELESELSAEYEHYLLSEDWFQD